MLLTGKAKADKWWQVEESTMRQNEYAIVGASPILEMMCLAWAIKAKKLRNHMAEERNTKLADRTITLEFEELVSADKKICYSFRVKKLHAPAKHAKQDRRLKKNSNTSEHKKGKA